ncbi:hypothetical protein DPMN_001035 [Dreissena polymorpha]|uniref:Uncharacterized protein n=2 Tax=Dreissena polymorpha TaxID=45954 RepID=A0A9D4MJ58_DREPO|nr:hypothetical protein DPMN_001035 [Dreissena polymorpha]
MAKNNFLQIPANAFENIDTTNATHITLVLSQNGISAIDDNAFNGIETEITELDLTNNDLTSLPIALGKLPNLAALWLSKNPLRSLTSQALFRVSLSVRELSLSLNNFSRWPRELHYFRFLHKLFVDGFTESRLPLDALSGLEKTITWFQVSESKLDLIPFVICHLPNLRYLDFISNWETQSPIFEPCNHNITEVHFLNLRNNTLKDFPDVLNSFTSLAILDVSVNNIRVIDSSLIPQNVSVTHLNLSHNAFTRVPSAITKFPYVTSLYLENNMITSLEDPDLGHLANLRVLDLSHNPIEYISGDAFAWQTTFDYLDLSSTRLVLIPSALASPRSIVTLDLSRSPIECTCKLAYMKKWSVNVTTISGTCEGTGELVNSFVTSFLPLCP